MFTTPATAAGSPSAPAPDAAAPGPTIVLVPGHWLGGWAWDEVADHLRARGHEVVAVTLPGYASDDADRSARTLRDQADALAEVIASAGTNGPPVVVGHSGASHPLSIVLDRDPGAVGRVIWVDSGPAAADSSADPDADPDLVDRPLPPFDVLGEGASLEGLDDVVLRRFRDGARPVPGAVLRDRAILTNPARHDVPTTIVACSMPSSVMLQLAAEGDPMMAPVAQLTDLQTVDLPTGHWPMWSRPADLADVIAQAAGGRPGA